LGQVGLGLAIAVGVGREVNEVGQDDGRLVGKQDGIELFEKTCRIARRPAHLRDIESRDGLTQKQVVFHVNRGDFITANGHPIIRLEKQIGAEEGRAQQEREAADEGGNFHGGIRKQRQLRQFHSRANSS